MKQYLYIIFIALTGFNLSGQITKFDKYDWNTIPEVLKQDTVKAVNGAKVTFERRIKEVYLNEQSYFEEINVFHQRIRVETHNAIDENNKIYIPVNDVIEILKIKARFISSTGKITELDQSSIKELDNLENKGDFKIFAIEGIEIGGEIEYFYILRNSYNPFQTIWLQGKDPRTNVEVIITFPSKIQYLAKSYNGFPDFIKTTNDSTEITTLQARAEYIQALADEEYSNYRANLMRVECTLAYNNYNSVLRVYSWAKAGNTFYNTVYKTSKSESSAVSRLAGELELKGSTVEQRVRNVENWVKTEISISEAIKQAPAIDEIIKYKQTSKFGATRLFVALFTKLNIPYELVISCNRENRKFDPDFNGWNFLDNYLIYFPDLNKYIVPDDPDIRLGVNAFNYQGEYGLFLHRITYDEKLETFGYEIKKLPVNPSCESMDSLMIKVNCDLSSLTSNVNIHREMSGALGYSFQSFWEGTNEERQRTIIGNIFDMGDKNTKIQNFEVKNSSRKDISVKPIIMDVNLTAFSLIESAGNDFIINIGRTIGTQSEMYQKTERKLPIVIDFEHGFYRKIEVPIPTGYKITNLEELNMKVEMNVDGKISAFFTSWYEMKGNTLLIYSYEMYPELSYPVSQFNQFRDVINAAADFNKKTLILTSEK